MWRGHGKTVQRMDIFDNSISTGILSGQRVAGQARGETMGETDNTKCLLKAIQKSAVECTWILKKSPYNEETMSQLNIPQRKTPVPEMGTCCWVTGVSETLPNIIDYYQGCWLPSTTCFWRHHLFIKSNMEKLSWCPVRSFNPTG